MRETTGQDDAGCGLCVDVHNLCEPCRRAYEALLDELHQGEDSGPEAPRCVVCEAERAGWTWHAGHAAAPAPVCWACLQDSVRLRAELDAVGIRPCAVTIEAL